jgi:hypothetical protein
MTLPEDILINSLIAADQSAAEATADPMYITDGSKVYTIEDGPCGFGWVNIKPARGQFVSYLKKIGIGTRDSYYGGYTVYSQARTQSMAKNFAWASAFAEVLNQYGINATAHQRMD